MLASHALRQVVSDYGQGHARPSAYAVQPKNLPFYY